MQTTEYVSLRFKCARPHARMRKPFFPFFFSRKVYGLSYDVPNGGGNTCPTETTNNHMDLTPHDGSNQETGSGFALTPTTLHDRNGSLVVTCFANTGHFCKGDNHGDLHSKQGYATSTRDLSFNLKKQKRGTTSSRTHTTHKNPEQEGYNTKQNHHTE